MIRWERVLLRDKNGNLIYPPSQYATGADGRMFEVSQIPLYIYMPIIEKSPSRQPLDQPISNIGML